MAYVEQKDYSRIISQQDLLDLLEEAAEDYSGKSSDEVRGEAEKTAEARIKQYLSNRYDMTTEFALTPTDQREETILYCYLTIAVYFLHFSINPRDIPKLRMREYNHCITHLKQIRDGEVSIDLTPDDETFGSVLIAGNSKFISKPFTDATVVDGTNN